MKPSELHLLSLPDYTKTEELCHSISHGVGVLFGVFALILGILHTTATIDRVCAVIYAVSMILLYAVSATYHALPKSDRKRGFRILDHCTVNLLIAGTYTPVALSAIRRINPTVGWILFFAVWAIGIFSSVFTCIDLQKYAKLSMVCYLLMGWCVIITVRVAIEALTVPGFLWLLSGGVSYTIGAVIYAAAKKKRYSHTIFHIFVLIGTILQFVAVDRFIFAVV